MSESHALAAAEIARLRQEVRELQAEIAALKDQLRARTREVSR